MASAARPLAGAGRSIFYSCHFRARDELMLTAKQNRFRCLIPPPALSRDLPKAAHSPPPCHPEPRNPSPPLPGRFPSRRRRERGSEWGALSQARGPQAPGARGQPRKRRKAAGAPEPWVPPQLPGRRSRSLCPAAPVLPWVDTDGFGVKKLRVCETVGCLLLVSPCVSLCLFLSFPPDLFSFSISYPSFQCPPLFSLCPHPRVLCPSLS